MTCYSHRFLLVLTLLVTLLPFRVHSIEASRSRTRRQKELAQVVDKANQFQAMLDNAQAIITANKQVAQGLDADENQQTTMVDAVKGKPSDLGQTDGRDLQNFQPQKRLPRYLPTRHSPRNSLKKQLQQCNSDLAMCNATNNQQNFLYVQMADSCTVERKGGKYALYTDNMDPDTYIFQDRPWRSTGSLSSSFFSGYLFDLFFSSCDSTAALTFEAYDNESQVSFQGPVISLALNTAEFTIQGDNSTLYKYDLYQSPDLSSFFRDFADLDENSNASYTFKTCSLLIDPSCAVVIEATEANGAFFNPKNNLVAIASANAAANKLNDAANKVQTLPVSSALSRYAKVYGVDAKDYLKGAADTMRSTASLIKQCNANCDANAIVEGISGILLSSAFVIGAAFPPAGIAIAIIGSIGLLVAAIFLGPGETSKIPPISASTVETAVDRAITLFTLHQNQDILNAYKVFLAIDIEEFIRFTGELGYMASTKGDNAQTKIDKQIENWYNQVWSPAWTGSFQPLLVKMEAYYNTWYGTNPSGIRSKLVAWINSCKEDTCQLSSQNLNLIADGNNRLNNCKDSVDKARENWRELFSFANVYLNTATKLSQMQSLVLVIMQQASNCDPLKYAEEIIIAECKWYAAMKDINAKVFQIQSRALFLEGAVKALAKSCDDKTWGWPFTQNCNTDKCNYKWGLAIAKGSWEDRLGSSNTPGKFVKLDESYYRSDSERTCQNNYNKWHGTLGYGSGGLYAWFDESRGVGQKLIPGNCAQITRDANPQFGRIVLGAIPSFCIPDGLTTCKTNIVNDTIWEIGQQ